MTCMALAAALASSASANWEIEGKSQASGFTETVKVAGGHFVLLGTFLGTTVRLTAASFECTAGKVCEISQTGTVDASSEQLTFTGVKVIEPSGCSAPTELTTNPLTDQLIMDSMAGSTATFAKFFTDRLEGIEEPFIEITLTGTCAIAGTPFPVKGTVTALTNNTGVSAVSQSLTFSAASQTTGGGSLILGKAQATIGGTASITLSGTNPGKSWGGS
jgi:hypothetical protein